MLKRLISATELGCSRLMAVNFATCRGDSRKPAFIVTFAFKLNITSMELIDTHCHLYLEEFDNDLEQIILRARQASVSRIYLPALDRAHATPLLALRSKYPELCRAMIGLHPCYVRDNFQEELDFVASALNGKNFAAVGEIGLDYYWTRDFDAYQQDAFRQQIRLAQDHQLPIVIHSRNSTDDCIKIVREESQGNITGIFHCFSGDLRQAEEIIDLGLVLGIGGVVTYKNSGLTPVIQEIPLHRVVLETDAPYLSPVPFRGKRNESSYLTYIAAKIAEIKNVDLEEVGRVTSETAKKVFGDD